MSSQIYGRHIKERSVMDDFKCLLNVNQVRYYNLIPRSNGLVLCVCTESIINTYDKYIISNSIWGLKSI